MPRPHPKPTVGGPQASAGALKEPQVIYREQSGLQNPALPHPSPSMHSVLTSGLQVLFCMWLPIDFFWGVSGPRENGGEGCGEQGQDSGRSNWMENPAGEVVPSAKAEVAGPDPLRSRSVLGFWARVRISSEALIPQRELRRGEKAVSRITFPLFTDRGVRKRSWYSAFACHCWSSQGFTDLRWVSRTHILFL